MCMYIVQGTYIWMNPLKRDYILFNPKSIWVNNSLLIFYEGGGGER